MDKTLTTQFILWLDSQGIQLRGEDTALIDTDRELPGLMDRFVDEWFTPGPICWSATPVAPKRSWIASRHKATLSARSGSEAGVGELTDPTDVGIIGGGGDRAALELP